MSEREGVFTLLLEDIPSDKDDAVSIFNVVLCDLYDWADRELIWLGI